MFTAPSLISFPGFSLRGRKREDPGKERMMILKKNKTLRSVHFGVVVVEVINCKCGGIVRNQIW